MLYKIILEVVVMTINKKINEFRKLTDNERVKKANEILAKFERPSFKKLSDELGFTHCEKFFKGYKINATTKCLEKDDVTQEVISLTQDDVIFLKKLIRRIESNKDFKSNGDVIVRSIRVDKEIMNKFVAYCDEMGLKQTQAINRALLEFMNK